MKKIIGILVLVIAVTVSVFCLVSDRNKDSKHDTEQNNPQENGKLSCTVTFDANGMNISNLPKPQEINVGEYVTEPEELICEGYFFIGWHTSPDAVALVDTPIVFEEYSVEKDTTLYAIWESKAIDIDGDGLNYQEEEQYGTDAFVLDTDFDGLSDGDEVNTRKTDPLNSDSDNDGILDGAEISLGLNPLSAMSDHTTEDSHRQIETKIQDDNQLFDLKICATPAMLSSISAETLPLNLLEDSEGLISPIIQVEYDKTKTFASAELTFDYSGVDLTGIDESNLTFLYLNEETGLYELIPSTVNKQEKIIRCAPTHFSMYAVGVRTMASRLVLNFKKANIAYSSDMIQASEVVSTGFDVRQHGFAFHNFQNKQEKIYGFCYGFSMVAYLNYVEKLPVARERLKGFTIHPGYDISTDERFYENQLYYEEEKNVFNRENDYELGDGLKYPVLKCITYWFLKQHNIRDKFFDNLADAAVFYKFINKLANDEPVPISLWRFGGAGHSVLACGLYQSETDPNVYYISVYDSNYPGEMRYIKLTKGGPLFGTNKLEYGKYTNFQMSNFDIPEGPYVPHKFNVSGTAVNESEGIAGAKVTIRNDKHTVSGYTDSKGAFKLADVPNGVYTVEISAAGYADIIMDDPLTVCGKNVDLANIQLTPKDTAKQLTQVDVKDSNGNLTSQYRYTYDGDLLTEITCQFFGEYAYRENRVLTYDSAGTLRSVSCKDSDDGSGTEYTFNSAGQLISESFSEGDGYTAEYEYDGQGKLIRKLKRECGDATVTEYQYDEKGVLTGALETTTTEYYDGEDYVIGEPSIRTFTFHHDSQGRLTKETSKDDFSEITTTYSYEYHPFILSTYEETGEYSDVFTKLTLRNENEFEIFSAYLSNPVFYMDVNGYVAKAVDTLTYVFYYDGISAEAVDENTSEDIGEGSAASGEGSVVDAYRKVLQQCSGGAEYTLYDVDKDGLSELIVHSDGYSVYTFNGSEAVLCGNCYTFYDGLYAFDGNGMIVHDGGFGRLHLEYVFLYKLSDNILVDEELISTEEASYDDIDDYLSEYSKIADFHSVSDYSLLEGQLA